MRSFVLAVVLACCVASLAPAGDRGDVKLTPKSTADLADFYVFQSPADPAATVLIVTLKTADGLFPEGDTSLNIAVDNTGNDSFDTLLKVQFGPDPQVVGGQLATLAQDGSPLAEGAVGQDLPIASGGQFRCGTFDDPFFAHAAGIAKFAKTGKAVDLAVAPVSNAYADADVLAVVIELPSGLLTADLPTISLSVGVFVNSVRTDRIGRPLVGTLLFSGKALKKFNKGDPPRDRLKVGAAAVRTLKKRYKRDKATALALRDQILPDVATFDPASAAGSPNGRRLDDDAVDLAATLVLGAPASDGVGVESPFSNTFPYLAPAD